MQLSSIRCVCTSDPQYPLAAPDPDAPVRTVSRITPGSIGLQERVELAARCVNSIV